MKKLIFHLYCDKEWETNEALKLHFSCLNYYSYIFDEILVVLSLDNEEYNTDFTSKLRCKITDVIRHPFLTIKIVKNTPYREVKTFYDEIVNKEYDGLIFFAHNKGYTNVKQSYYKKEYIFSWIVGMYWLSLTNIKEMEEELLINDKFFYGSFKVGEKNVPFNIHNLYAGTFFWINITNIKLNYLYLHEQNGIPKMGTKMSAENFPGLVCLKFYNKHNIDKSSSYRNWKWYFSAIDFYGTEENGFSPKDAIQYAFPDQASDFNAFYDKMAATIAF